METGCKSVIILLKSEVCRCIFVRSYLRDYWPDSKNYFAIGVTISLAIG